MFDLKQFLTDNRLDSISYTYTHYGIIIVTCILNPSYHKDIPVYGFAATDDEAREQALSVLNQVRKLGFRFEAPTIAMKNGHAHINVKQEEGVNTVVSFINTNGVVAITGISLQDDAGFYIHENPEFADLEIYHPVKENNPYAHEVCLKAGEKLYAWDTCRGLSGSFGLAVLDSENRLLRSKMIGMS